MKQRLRENFLRRWSRLKRDPSQLAEKPPTVAALDSSAARPALPELDSLEFSSDFTAFMAEEVDAGLRRVALKKLFHAEHFNVMDGLDTYIDDYNTFEPISAEMLKNLNQARGLLFDDTAAAENTDPPVATALDTGAAGIAADPPDDAPATRDTATDENQ